MLKTTRLIMLCAFVVLAMSFVLVAQEKNSTPDNCAVSDVAGQNKCAVNNVTNSPRIEPFWGTGEISQRVAATAAVPYSSNMTYTNFTSDGGRYRSGGSDYWFDLPLHLPAGAYLMHYYIAICDSDAANDIMSWLFVCPDSSGSCTTLGQIDSNGAPGCTGIFSPTIGITVNNFSNYYFIRFRVEGTTNANEIRSAEMHYQLQVSPAPGTATFLDVPTSHIFFQYVQALVASGITSGCDASNYCPNNAVTRGQMAKFLSVALGLHWSY